MDNIKISNSRNKVIETTGDYSIFKLLNGNRAILASRVEKIKKSIMEVGYVTSPILVNEKYEVIDGQGRVEALKQLGMPVDYIVVPGIGIKECISLNLEQTNWKIIDFVKSYKDQGNESYSRIYELIIKYKSLGIDTIMYAVYGIKVTMQHVKAGEIECSEEEFRNAEETLQYISKFTKCSIKPNSYILNALVYCFWKADIDNEAMFNNYIEKCSFISKPSGILQAFDELSKIYNGRRRTKVFLSTDYQRDMSDKYSWYRKRYVKITRTSVV